MANRKSTWGVVIAVSLTAALVSSAEPGAAANGGRGIERRLSQAGPDGDARFRSSDVALAFDARAGRYLAVWASDTSNDNEFEVFGRFLTRSGALIGGQFQVSTAGPAGDIRFDAGRPDVVYNATANEFLVAWEGADASALETEIFVQRLTPDGDRLGVDGQQVSTMGPDGNSAFDAVDPSLAYNPTADEYLVAWRGDDDAATLVDNEFEIFIQRLAADGTEIGADDQRISSAGVDGIGGVSGAFEPSVTYNTVGNEYLVAWHGDDDSATPLVDNEFEIFAQRISADGSEIGTDDQRISDMGTDSDPTFFALTPSVAHNQKGEYLVAWQGRDNRGGTGISIFTQRVSVAGVELLPNDRRVSTIGPDGSHLSAQLNPALVYNPVGNEYLVAWSSNRVASLPVGENEIVAQRLTSVGGELGADDQRISDQGPEGDLSFAADSPAIAFDATLERYLLAWHGDDDTGAPVQGQTEVFGRTLGSP